jgi:hypothetical protein
VLTERVLAGQGPIETVPANRSITVLDLMRHTSCPAGVSAGTEVAAGRSGGGLSAATLTARFGVAGDIPRRFAAPAAIASRIIGLHAITEIIACRWGYVIEKWASLACFRFVTRP